MVPILSSGLTSAIESAPWFAQGHGPYLLLDPELRIRAVNGAYARATAHFPDMLLGEYLFDAFPDNPADAHADGVAKLSASLERVFRRGHRDWMAFQRYDVRDRRAPERFVLKIWAPVNLPVKQSGRTVGILHHVQDVTGPLIGTEGRAPAAARPDLAALADLLERQFPDVAPQTVLGVLTHSEQVVLETIGAPDADRISDLARLRLEVRTGHAAWVTADGDGP